MNKSNDNTNTLHILSEAVIVGGLSVYFYKQINDLKSTIDELKNQLMVQNNQINYLLSFSNPNYGNLNHGNLNHGNLNHRHNIPPTTQLTTPLIPSHLTQRPIPQKENFEPRQMAPKEPPKAPKEPPKAPKEPPKAPKEPKVECEGGVCRLVKQQPKELVAEKKVVISKIAKQIEFDRENIEQDQTRKVGTFTYFSPNPMVKSVTPKPSTSASVPEKVEQNELEKILQDIDDDE
jgi:hypothetical protein